MTPPQVGTVPQDSGYVNDPVCTATGHLLVDSRDFAMPPRLDVMSFRRTYASQSMQPAAFGPGWWTLDGVPCRRATPTARSHYVGPDALQFDVHAADGGGWSRPDLDLDVEPVDGTTQRLRWGRRSRTPNQHWTFRDGLLVEVAGPFIGSTSFEYGSRRLTRLGPRQRSRPGVALEGRPRRRRSHRPTAGRPVRLQPGRRASSLSTTLARRRPTSVDDAGRILSITDADGIRTVAMVYDDEGRVVEQTSATGFTTRFDYDDVRRTTLSDPDYNPLSVYTHDERGRVEMYATGGGFRFTRRFDALGRVVSQRDPDGTQLHARRLARRRSRTSRRCAGRAATSSATTTTTSTASCASHRNASTTSFSYAGDSMFPSRIEVAGEQGLAVDLDWQFGTPTRIVDSDGVVDHLAVRPDGTIASATNGVGDTTRYDVDASGAVVAVHHPDGRVVRYERDEAGRLTAMVNAAGQRGEIRYTPAGRILSCVDPTAPSPRVEYDAAGLPARLVAADGTATDLLVDDKQRIVGARFANGDAIGLQLDEFGRADRRRRQRRPLGDGARPVRPHRQANATRRGRRARPGVRRARRVDADHRRRRADLADRARPRQPGAHA